MPTRNRFFLKALLPLGLLVVAALALFRRGGDNWEYGQDDVATEDMPAVPPVHRHRGRGARIALAAGFTVIFFAGASFTAGAGDRLVRLADEDAAALVTDGSTAALASEAEAQPAEAAPAEAVPAQEAAAEPAPQPESAPEATAPEATAPEATVPEQTPEGAAPVSAAAAAEATLPAEAVTTAPAPSNVVAPAPVEREVQSTTPAPRAQAAPTAKTGTPTKQWVVKRAAAVAPVKPEIDDEGGEPTIWLNRALPDPTPPSARLARAFAQDLVAASKQHGADWAAVLGVLRAEGERGSLPANATQLDTLASKLAHHDTWKGALAISGRTSFADRAEALADLYRSVGIEALVVGLEASKARLGKQLLANSRVLIYGAGRNDIASGRVDVRVIVLLGYLAERHGSVTVSSLFSGHRKFARAGVVSAHMYGHAADIAAVGDIAIAGHQQPGSITEAAVRSVLLLPAELQPQQVISLIGLGGPSFPLRDHGDHIHVGY
ncbi:MAG TPA: hypothetical protein VM049_10925 [Gaiellaceae bacterium]|nr:hypothetical protein [Gaiellaceae bacterium]